VNLPAIIGHRSKRRKASAVPREVIPITDRRRTTVGKVDCDQPWSSLTS
jgi:hypothetical protein